MELTALLERMKMEHLLAQLDGVCEHAAKGDLDYKGFLTQALEAEWRGRHQRGVESRLKPRWTPENRPVVDGAKPASGSAAPSTSVLPRSIVVEQVVPSLTVTRQRGRLAAASASSWGRT
jgi:hypothetical protein